MTGITEDAKGCSLNTKNLEDKASNTQKLSNSKLPLHL